MEPYSPAMEQPFEIPSVLSSADEVERKTERVMDEWIRLEKKADPALTRMPGRVKRRTVKDTVYRYQSQDQTKNNVHTYGFSVSSLEDDVKMQSTILLFAETKSGSYQWAEYPFKEWGKNYTSATARVLIAPNNWSRNRISIK